MDKKEVTDGDIKEVVARLGEHTSKLLSDRGISGNLLDFPGVNIIIEIFGKYFELAFLKKRYSL